MDPKQQEAEKPERVQIKSLRTYQGDIEEAMSKNKYSATTILVAEQKRRQEVPRVQEKNFSVEARNKLFTIVGICLLFFGGIVVYAVYYVRSNEQVVIEQKTKALIEFLTEKNLYVASSTKDSLVSKIISEKNTWNAPVNSVLYLNMLRSEETPESTQNIVNLLFPSMPSSLARSFGDKYMVGIISYDNTEPFIILTVEDYPASYAGMLRWEKDMQSDLAKLFTITENTGTTTRQFVDEAIRNKDLRVLKDNKNETMLVYSFVDKSTLLIAKNENLFNAILAKYLTSKSTR